MLYRVRRYVAVPERLAAFHDFFNAHLLPVQVRHGARLVGRWETDDDEVIAVWEYDDMPAYERIDAAVRADPDSARAQRQRNTLGLLFTEKHETFARSTVPSTTARVSTNCCIEGRER
jgi:NIPSNAP